MEFTPVRKISVWIRPTARPWNPWWTPDTGRDSKRQVQKETGSRSEERLPVSEAISAAVAQCWALTLGSLMEALDSAARDSMASSGSPCSPCRSC